jgi:hypothetical protein
VPLHQRCESGLVLVPHEGLEQVAIAPFSVGGNGRQPHDLAQLSSGHGGILSPTVYLLNAAASANGTKKKTCLG